MRCAVDLDDQLSLAAGKINEIGSDGCLANEFEAAERAIAQLSLKLRLGRDLSGAQDARAVRSPRLRATHDRVRWNQLLPLTLTLSPCLE